MDDLGNGDDRALLFPFVKLIIHSSNSICRRPLCSLPRPASPKLLSYNTRGDARQTHFLPQRNVQKLALIVEDAVQSRHPSLLIIGFPLPKHTALLPQA